MKNDMVKFEIDGLPPSVNHALGQTPGGRRYPTKEYRAWKNKCDKIDVKKIEDSKWYEVERVYYFPLLYKNGSVRKKDVGNFIKYSDDEICRKLITYSGKEIDDSQIIRGSEDKRDCKEGEERTEYTIWTVE